MRAFARLNLFVIFDLVQYLLRDRLDYPVR
jgi:hypothetical protein